MATKDYDLPFNDAPVKTKKEFNQHLSAQSKKFQSLNTFPTFGLWGALYDAVAPVSNTGEKVTTMRREYEDTFGKFYKDYPVVEAQIVLTDDTKTSINP